jgi:hypothetical protein
MGQDPRADGSAVMNDRGAAAPHEREPETIRREIEGTRQELGDTVANLAVKADVKAQAKQKVEQTKASLAEKRADLLGRARSASPEGATSFASGASTRARENPLVPAIAAAFAAGLVIGRARRPAS